MSEGGDFGGGDFGGGDYGGGDYGGGDYGFTDIPYFWFPFISNGRGRIGFFGKLVWAIIWIVAIVLVLEYAGTRWYSFDILQPAWLTWVPTWVIDYLPDWLVNNFA